MSLEWFRCPDNQVIQCQLCLEKCRLGVRCAPAPYLKHISKEREWAGKPSTTQLLNGTLMEYLKITKPYAVDPDGRVFTTHGSMAHLDMHKAAQELGIPSEVALTVDRDIFDLLETIGYSEGNEWKVTGFRLVDTKTWGSYRVAKALGIKESGKMPDPSGEVYKISGRWGKAGDPKMVPVFARNPELADMWETEMQLGNYQRKLEELSPTIKVLERMVFILVRDGSTMTARQRGVDRNMYYEVVREVPRQEVADYFDAKEKDLLAALSAGRWDATCNDRETWDGRRCMEYCEVWMYCPKGQMLRKDKGVAEDAQSV